MGEDGAPAAWSRYGGELSLVSQPVHSGLYAGRLESTTDSTKWIYQAVMIDPGSHYAFDAWVAEEDARAGSASLRISWYDSDDASGRALATSDSTNRIDASSASNYQHLTTGSVSAPDTARSARLRVLIVPSSAASAAVYVDDASFGSAEANSIPLAAAPPSTNGTEDPIEGDAPSASRLVLGNRKAPSRPPADAGNTSAGTHVVLNEVLYDPIGNGPDGANEWVELYNPGDLPIDLAGWSVADGASIEPISEAQIGAHAFAVLAASDSFSKAYPEFHGTLIPVVGRIGNSLGNDGDRIALRDSSMALVDAISWGTDSTVLNPAIPDVPAGHSIERRVAGADTDTAGDFVDNESPSPGAAIAALSTQPKRGAASPSSAEILAAGSNPRTRRLPWIVMSAAGAALVLIVLWRLLPLITARLRPHA